MSFSSSDPATAWFKTLTFSYSAATVDTLSKDEGQEVALVGHSNVGKSSIINALAQRKNLARYSKQPGRTQTLNVFSFQALPSKRIVDLPGYGYSQTPKSLRARWDSELAKYFRNRTTLTDILWVIDIRRNFNALDDQVLALVHQCQRRVHLVLNKLDKLSKKAARERLNYFEEQVQQLGSQMLLIEPCFWPLSAQSLCGVDKLRTFLAELLAPDVTAKKA